MDFQRSPVKQVYEKEDGYLLAKEKDEKGKNPSPSSLPLLFK
jgi:hypothetical protein